MDLAVLKTLPQREFCNGLAEVIKTGVIRDSYLFEFLEVNVDSILNQKDERALKEIVFRSARTKSEVITLDPTEAGIRCILNFGHTIGHAIEAYAFPFMLHGECVSIGMVLECKLALKMNHLKNSSFIGRLIRCLQSYHLPVVIPKKKKTETDQSFLNITPQDLIDKMLIDKKNASGNIRCVIIKDLGDVFEYPVVVDQGEPLSLSLSLLSTTGINRLNKDTLKQVLLPTVSVEPPQAGISGHIMVPGSKSISNRVLTMAALGKGKRPSAGNICLCACLFTCCDRRVSHKRSSFG